MTAVLGINAYHPNASAALMLDGDVVAAAEEERFTRRKYEVAFPHQSIRYCLEAGGISVGDLDHVAVAGNPLANLWRKAWFAVGTRAGRRLAPTRVDLLALLRVKRPLAEGQGVDPRAVRARVHMVEHHRAHIASAFHASPFDRAAVASLDGIGDMVSAMWGTGEGSRLSIRGEVFTTFSRTTAPSMMPSPGTWSAAHVLYSIILRPIGTLVSRNISKQ